MGERGTPRGINQGPKKSAAETELLVFVKRARKIKFSGRRFQAALVIRFLFGLCTRKGDRQTKQASFNRRPTIKKPDGQSSFSETWPATENRHRGQPHSGQASGFHVPEAPKGADNWPLTKPGRGGNFATAPRGI